MHQGYVRDADRLNAQLERYAEDSRYQEMFIDLVRNAFYRIQFNVMSRSLTFFGFSNNPSVAWYPKMDNQERRCLATMVFDWFSKVVVFVLVLRLYRSCDASIIVSYTFSCRYPHDCVYFLCPVSVCEPLGPYSSGDVLSSPNLHYIQDTGTEVRS